MPSTTQEWIFALALLLFGIFLVWFCLWLWGSIARAVWQERSAISQFFRSSPIGDWILRIFLAVPVFTLIVMAFDSTNDSILEFFVFSFWAVCAFYLYFMWL